ncbi:MAG TPA: L-threonylcarbamoyladenylate synthase [bacterium]|jgi:L-threonylcarbamoyladenylate synthase|nr:L-threonylcarbamoyladenylate synthase [bacterium]HNT64356.1 L-threonylcarbamoyladenylate synthase [bacterium]HOX85346.1 L-threonylcarbamoyladenylate synthase [bacterium]HPG44505.1 L-threonylcarbamoyladenylate synthase [bacterium]HPM97063.1 L-threonylcarbamoyladenylate synthase [bacterium]
MSLIRINPYAPEEELIGQASRVLKKGGVIGYPTDTVYGIGCNAFDHKAVNRIYDLKNRDHSKAMILIAADLIQIQDLVKEIPESAQILAENFWPGPLTIVFELSEKFTALTVGNRNTVAIRIPDSLISLSLLKSCGFPIVSTSANRSGQPESVIAEQVLETFGSELDLIIDGGPTPSSLTSTVVDVTRPKPKVLREGAVSILEINTVLDIL